MPGPYDGAEVLVWVDMNEPTTASSVYGAGANALGLTLNNTGLNGAGLTNSIQFLSTSSGTAAPVVTVSYASGSTIINLAAAATGLEATATKAAAAINASPAAKYYVTASVPGAGTGAVAAVTQGYIGANGTINVAGADAAINDLNWLPVSRQQGVDYDDTMDTIDAVSKGDRFALQLAGRQSGSFELSGLHSFEDKTQERVRRAYQRRELLLFRRVYPGTVGADPVTGAATAIVHEASCRVTGFSISHPDSDVATFSAPVSLQENWRVV